MIVMGIVKIWQNALNGLFLHDTMAAILLDKNEGTAAMLVDQNNPQGMEFVFWFK